VDHRLPRKPLIIAGFALDFEGFLAVAQRAVRPRKRHNRAARAAR
jgi:hypothetical protein